MLAPFVYQTVPDTSTSSDDDRNSDDYFYLRIRTDTRTFLFREKDRSYVSLWYDALKATQVNVYQRVPRGSMPRNNINS